MARHVRDKSWRALVAMRVSSKVAMAAVHWGRLGHDNRTSAVSRVLNVDANQSVHMEVSWEGYAVRLLAWGRGSSVEAVSPLSSFSFCSTGCSVV